MKSSFRPSLFHLVIISPARDNLLSLFTLMFHLILFMLMKKFIFYILIPHIGHRKIIALNIEYELFIILMIFYCSYVLILKYRGNIWYVKYMILIWANILPFVNRNAYFSASLLFYKICLILTNIFFINWAMLLIITCVNMMV